MADPAAPQPSSQGTLDKTPLAHQLVYMHERKPSGTIELVAPGGEAATIVIVRGRPAKVRTSEPVAYLGRVLLELGAFNEAQLALSVRKLTQEKKLHGQILVDSGLITNEQLENGLKAQLTRKLRYLAGLPPTTEFRFYESYDALKGYGRDSSVSIDPLPVVWTAIREQPPLEHVKAALARLGTSGLRLVSAADTSRFEFESSESSVIALLRARPRRLSDLAAAGILSPRVVQLLVYCLLISKQLEAVHESQIPPSGSSLAPAEPEPAPEPRTPDPPQARGARRGEGRARGVTEERRADMPHDPRMTPPERPASLSDPAPPTPRAPTPLDAFTKSTSPPDPGPASTAPKPFSMKAPKAPALRGGPMGEMHTKPTVPQMQAVRLPPEAVPPRPMKLETPFPGMAPNDLIRAASAANARGAVSNARAPSRQTAETLLEVDDPGDFEVELEELTAHAGSTAEAAESFKNALAALSANDLAKAEPFAKRAAEGDAKSAEHVALYAWVVASKPEKQGLIATELAIEKLDTALRLDARCQRALLYRGTLKKRAGRMDEALQDFRALLDIAPGHLDATREMKAITEPKVEEDRGRLGRFWKK